MIPPEEHIDKLLKDSVKQHSRRKDQVKRFAWTVRIAVMALSMLTTIVLGVSVKNPEYLPLSRNVALVLGALSTFLAGLASFWDLDRYWLKRKVILSQLEALSQEFAYLRSKSPQLELGDLDRVFNQYSRIISQQTEYWENALVRTAPQDSASARQKGTRQEEAVASADEALPLVRAVEGSAHPSGSE